MGYVCIIGVLLVLMNTYPLLMNQNLIFRAKQTALTNQAALVTNTLVTADDLTPEAVTQAVDQLEDLEVQRLVVTDEAGLVLYDTGEATAVGRYLLQGEVVSALEGNDAFSSHYAGGVIYSRFATPVMDRNQVAGAVYLYEEDSGQGTLLVELQRNLRLISVVVCLAVLVLFWAFSAFLSRRVNTLLGGMRTELAEEFNQLTGRLQVTEEERRRFVSDASHELKTPLASIRLLTDSILQDENIDKATAREFVADIGEATDRLIRISQELLELNRLDEGRTVLQEAVDLNAQVGKAARLLLPLAESTEVTLETDLEPGCAILCNQEDTMQILRNLMENAIKYNTPQGRVWVTTRRVGDRVRLEVADTGVGIPPEDMPKIFQRFYRVDKARSRAAGGTGLGLSIARDAVRRHGGEIAVAPREGGGTLFTVTFRVGEGGEPA